MPAPQEISSIKTLGIIAGSGVFPLELVEQCKAQNIETYVLGFKDQTDPAVMEASTHHEWCSLGAAGTMMKIMRQHHIKDLVLIGGMRRPSLWELKPDFEAFKIMTRIGLHVMGDSSFLTALRKELEAEGFTLHGIHKFCQNLLVEEGVIGSQHPTEQQQTDINIGIKASQDLGAKDIGQAVVVQQGEVLCVEDDKGTDALIKRCGEIKKEGAGPILVKTCKPQQDRDLDLPAIGPDTILAAHNAGFSGIVLQAGATLLIQRKIVEDLANQYNMFIAALPVENHAG